MNVFIADSIRTAVIEAAAGDKCTIGSLIDWCKATMNWVDPLMRIQCPSEFLALQGFPVYPFTKPFGEPCSFEGRIGGRDGRRVVEQAGNSMPIPMVGLAVMYAWTVCLLSDHVDLSSVCESSGSHSSSFSSSADACASASAHLPSEPSAAPRLLRSIFDEDAKRLKRS